MTLHPRESYSYPPFEIDNRKGAKRRTSTVSLAAR